MATAPLRSQKARHRVRGNGAGRSRLWAGLVAFLVIGLGVLAAAILPRDDTVGSGPPPADREYRAFAPGSWWNTPLPADAPLDPNGEQILQYLQSGPESGRGCLMLAGAGHSHWGTPIYWAEPGDPRYDVTGIVGQRPPELRALRIPRRAEPASNNDGTMSIYDLQKGYVVALTGADYEQATDTWTASGATVTYLDSNGLHVATGRSDDRRNRGTHRGNNGATMAVAWHEVLAGDVRHVLKVAAGPEVADRFVFPMVGSDGDRHGNDPGVPPQGIRLRIKPDIQLRSLSLDSEALVIARALQRYGFYIGDSGGVTSLKLENTMAEGLGQKWRVSADALCGLPFTPRYWDVIAEGYDPSTGGKGRG